jgi:hypothetical protein
MSHDELSQYFFIVLELIELENDMLKFFQGDMLSGSGSGPCFFSALLDFWKK